MRKKHLTLVSDERKVEDMSSDTWQILGTYPSVNGQFKITARRGGQVVHIDRLTQEQVDTLDAAAIENFWAKGRKR